MLKTTAPSINLAKNRGETFIDRFLGWALTVGRALVILTEAVALGAFLYRFGLDRQMVDLHDRIKQEEAIVQLLKTNETTYRNLQDRLALAKSLDEQLAGSITRYQDLSAFIPSDMNLTTFSLQTDDVHIDGDLSSLVSLDSLVNKLKAYPAISRVSIDKIQNKSANGSLTVGVTALFVKKGQHIQ